MTGEMKDWQRGYPLEWLKALAVPFKLCYGPHTYGAFGMVKERDIATALAEQKLLWRGNLEAGVRAAGIATVLKSGSQHHDYAGRTLKLQKGDALISDLACLPDEEPAAFALINATIDRADHTPGATGLVVAIIHEESCDLRRAMERAGFSWIMTKISASSDLLGVYGWSRDHTVLFDRAKAAGFAHEADLRTLAAVREEFINETEQRLVLEELDAYEAQEPWKQHYSSYNKRQSWTAFALRGYVPADPGFIIKPAEMSKAWKEEHASLLTAQSEWTVAAEHFPTTLEVVGRIPGDKDRVRLMRLSASGELTRHADITDRQAGTADGCVVRLHIPLRTDPAVLMNAWDQRGRQITKHFAERGLFYLDQRKPHAVKNYAQVERIHLVVDAISTPELRSWLVEAA